MESYIVDGNNILEVFLLSELKLQKKIQDLFY
jgi:hypothetical protein